jgi:hypothetical protein
MIDATRRAISRWIHIVFGIPIVGYVYSPFKELPNYAPVVRVGRPSDDCSFGTVDVERPSRSATYFENAQTPSVVATNI